MTKEFDNFFKTLIEKAYHCSPHKIKEDLDVSGVYGSDSSYDTSDGRVPFYMGTISRRGKVKNKKRKRTIKENIDKDYWQYEGCGILALYINEMLKLPIIIFKDVDDSTIAHVGNLLDGKIIDSVGIRTIQEIKNQYYDIPNIVAEKISKENLLEYMGDEDQPLYGPDDELENEAKQFITNFIIPIIK